MWTCPKRQIRDTFRVGIHDAAKEFRLKIEGHFVAAESADVELCWRTAASTIVGRQFTVDLSSVTSIDSTANRLLMRMRENGAAFVAGTPEVMRGIGGFAGAHVVGQPSGRDRLRLFRDFQALLACLFVRLRAWA